MRVRAIALVAAVVAAAATLTACGSSSGSTSSSAAPSAPVVVTDAWVRSWDGMMTGIFAKISNTTSSDITIVSGKTTLSNVTQFHEVVTVDGEQVMREHEGGFVVPAGGTLVLQPGSYHIMAMDLAKPVAIGDEATVTLTLSTGDTVTFSVIGKEFTGGGETYHPSGSMSMPMSSSSSME